MPTQQEVQVDVDVWKSAMQSEIESIKKIQEKDHDRIDKLETKTEFHERDIKDIKATLKEIKDDTKWLKRTITMAIIGAICTGVIGGAIGLIFYLLQKNIGV